jgi:hypothetical protein
MMRAGIFACLAFAAVMANARVLDLPWGPMKRLPSPDGTLVLYGKTGVNEPQLWIEDTRTHRRTKLFDIASTLTAGWSRDGSAFYVNDHSGSDEEEAYIYDAATLNRVDAGARILVEDAKSRPFSKGHAYFRVEHWEGNQEVAVRFFGHTDEPPVTHFDFRYRVSRTGAVKKLSQHTAPVKD